MNYENISDTLMRLAGVRDDVLVVHRAYVELTGSLEAGIMLSQLLYWTPRSKNQGWIAKSDAEFSKELLISIYAVRISRALLETLGILETEVHKFDGAPTCHYRLKLEALSILWIQKMDSSKSQNPFCENKESLTEITTQTTTLIPPPQKPRTKEDLQAMTKDALAGWNQNPDREGITNYPADVQDALKKIFKLWNLIPPPRDSNGYSFWIRGARDLKLACGEWGIDLLDELVADTTNLTIANPVSLVKMATARAAVKRRSTGAPEPGKDYSYHWNSDLSEEENIRLMQQHRPPEK